MPSEAPDRQKSDAEREAVKLWRAWRTVHEMVADRGYELTDEEIRIPLDHFKSTYCNADGTPNRAAMNFTARPSQAMIAKYTAPVTDAEPNPKAEIGTIYIEFLGDESVGIKQMRNFAQSVLKGSHYGGILVTKVNITPSALKIIPAVAAQTKIEVFNEQDLLVNITHHDLVPKHILLSGEEKQALLKRYRLKATQLPRIQLGDPVARYYGLRRGQVVKIIRHSETAGRYASYRYTV